jgi:pimeloyl-ACP methyl ester carboxylesterase
MLKTVPSSATIPELSLTFDVSGQGELAGSLLLSATCYLPPSAFHEPPKIWAWLMHGATYDRRYWDLTVPGYPPDAYSAARYLAQRGIACVALDLPGCGQSRWAVEGKFGDGRQLTLEATAAALHAATQQLRDRLASGYLFAGLLPCQEIVLIGFGHSLGGGIAIVQQGISSSFEALGVLGISCDLTKLEALGKPLLAEWPVDAHGCYRDLRTFPGLQEWFYLEDVPAAVQHADEAASSPVPVGLVQDLLTPGLLARHASAIRSPVLLAFGEVDLASDPRREVMYYAMEDCTLYELPGSAHCHNLAGTRQELWSVMYAWLWSVVRSSYGINLRQAA